MVFAKESKWAFENLIFDFGSLLDGEKDNWIKALTLGKAFHT